MFSFVSLQVDIGQDTNLIHSGTVMMNYYFQSCDFLDKISYVNTKCIISSAHFRVKKK